MVAVAAGLMVPVSLLALGRLASTGHPVILPRRISAGAEVVLDGGISLREVRPSEYPAGAGA